MITIIVSLAAIALGLVLGSLVQKSASKRKAESAEAKAEKILNDAKAKAQDVLLQAKEKVLKQHEDAKHDEEARRAEVRDLSRRLEQRENMFDKKLLEFEDEKQKLVLANSALDKMRADLEILRRQELVKLENIANLSQEEAKQKLVKGVEEEMRDALISRIKKLDAATAEETEAKVKELMTPVIQRIASSHAAEITTTRVDLPNEEIKGRIIGKEGRNIKTLEHLTGTEIVIDETPGMLLISGFSPIRRQVAKRALEELIKDGRIQPARIEEVVENAKKELAADIKKAGEEALYEMGITGLDPKLVSILGRLKYRTSYGQSVLLHSMEVARVATALAEELGADVINCKKGGLLHDIGKAIDHDVQGAHPQLGYDLMKKFNLPEEIAYHSIGHHEDKPRTLEAVIVKVADAVSASRPGARRESTEMYLQRLEELEKTATSFPGVEKAYAIQAGREVRVFVKPQEIDDYNAWELAKNIARRIEQDMNYPGEIRVNVIRETRVTEYAR